MDATTLEALKASIEHWRRMATGKANPGEAPIRDCCALCDLFNNDTQFILEQCVGCPVFERTGRQGCAGTPYEDAYSRWKRLTTAYLVLNKDSCFQLFARDELVFLESLLPISEIISPEVDFQI